MTRIEDELLSAARDKNLRLRLSLSNRQRLSAVVADFGRFDLKVDTGEGELTLSKKDVYYISYPQPVIEFVRPDEPEQPEDRHNRSRVQDEFLERYVKDKTLALLSFVNGDEYRGVIEGFDGFTVLLKAGQGQVLAYKHGLLAIGPGYRRRQGSA